MRQKITLNNPGIWGMSVDTVHRKGAVRGVVGIAGGVVSG
jgi:hypothetical protein